jgi:hypothetical protein
MDGNPLWEGVWSPDNYGFSMPLLRFSVFGQAYDSNGPFSTDGSQCSSSLTFVTGIHAKAEPLRDLAHPDSHQMTGGKIDLFK